MEYIRPVDLASYAPDRREVREIAGRDTGVDSCVVRCQRIPAGEEGRREFHVHAVDQFYWIVSGVMTVEIGSDEYTAGPNSLVVLPRGMPHRASNLGDEDCVHLEVLSPHPQPGGPWLMRVQMTR